MDQMDFPEPDIPINARRVIEDGFPFLYLWFFSRSYDATEPIVEYGTISIGFGNHQKICGDAPKTCSDAYPFSPLLYHSGVFSLSPARQAPPCLVIHRLHSMAGTRHRHAMHQSVPARPTAGLSMDQPLMAALMAPAKVNRANSVAKTRP